MLSPLYALKRCARFLVVTGVFSVLGACLPAYAQNACDATASLVNPAAGHGGIGGTGAPVRNALGDTAQDSVAGRPGLGGTGIDDSGVGGMGGTGIVGVITGFASICVNGLEVHYDTGMPVSADGRTTTVRELAVGQVVAIRAVGTGDQLSARAIAVMHVAVGPVSRVDSKTGQLQVLGQSVRVADRAALVALKPGDWVQVSGYRLLSGEVAASRVEPVAAQAQVQLTGSMGHVIGKGFSLHGTRISVDGPRLSSEAVAGSEVTVRGRWDGTTLHAQGVEVEPARHKVGRVDRVVLEGYVHALRGNELSLGNRVVTLAPGARISGKSGVALAVNQRVQLSGQVGKDQRVTVDRVNVRSGVLDAGRIPVVTPRSEKDDKTSDDSQRGSDDSGTSSSRSGSSGSDDGGISGSSGTSGSTSSTSGSSGSGSSGSSGSGSSGGSSSGSNSGSSGSSGTSGSSGSNSGSSGSSGSGKSGSGKK